MILILLLGVLLAAAACALAVRALTAGRIHHHELLVQIGSYGFAAEASNDTGPIVRDTFDRLVVSLGASFEKRMSDARRREVRVSLTAAGFYRTTVARYLGYRVLSAVGVPLVVLLLFIVGGSLSATAIVVVIALGAFGWIFPPIYLQRRAAGRIDKIDYEVPELVDLLVTTVEAGVGFLASLQIAGRRVREPLGQELRLALREQGMGLSLDEALTNLAARSDSPNLRTFVQAILQGETLGVSIGKILRDLAVDMRKRRRQMAEEKAQKAPVKLLFPLVFLILPAMLIVLLGPTLYSLGSQLG